MDILQTALSDAALLLFSFAGLLVTAVAILRDTRAQQAQHAELGELRLER